MDQRIPQAIGSHFLPYSLFIIFKGTQIWTFIIGSRGEGVPVILISIEFSSVNKPLSFLPVVIIT